jgi:BolA protein
VVVEKEACRRKTSTQMLLNMPLRKVLMTSMQSHLEEQLKIALEPSHLEVINESSNHSGPATESHFKLVVVSEIFDKMKLIDRHRFINKLFKEELNHIHALAMHTYTPSEWKVRQSSPDSPLCASKTK